MRLAKMKFNLHNLSNITMLVLIFIIVCMMVLSRFPSHSIFLFPADNHLGHLSSSADAISRLYTINFSLNSVDVNVVPSCGCTTISTTQSRLLPLTVGVTDIKINTKYLKHGRHAKNILLEFRHDEVEWERDAIIHFSN